MVVVGSVLRRIPKQRSEQVLSSLGWRALRAVCARFEYPITAHFNGAAATIAGAMHAQPLGKQNGAQRSSVLLTLH